MANFYRWENGALHLFVRVQPKASRDEWAEVQEERVRIRITAPPVDGKANQHLIGLIAKAFGVAKANVTLVSGEVGRNKHLLIKSPTRLPAGISKEG
ncbi:MAG: DUF167 family protein [Thiothrix sp.]